MGTVCEFELRSGSLPLTAVAAALETILTVEEVISGTDGPPAAVFSATGVDPDRLEATMDEHEPVVAYAALESGVVTSRYRVEIDTDHTDVYTQLIDLQTHPVGAVVTGHGWKVTAQFADREELNEFRGACNETTVRFRPLRVFEGDADPTDDYGLTAAQHEALRAALEIGYFKVPREGDLSELAEELDTTTSALSERLRRAQQQLVSRTIGSPDQF